MLGQLSPTTRVLITSLSHLVVCSKHVKLAFLCSCPQHEVASVAQGLPLPVWVRVPHWQQL